MNSSSGENEESRVNLKNVPPIQQKRTLAFVNHFILSTVQFLNNFSISCESKLQEIEKKIQRVEACLIILETKLSSIPELDTKETNSQNENVEDVTSDKLDNAENLVETIIEIESQNIKENDVDTISSKPDPVIERFMKMVQVGVPLNAVKLKMQLEGIDGCILDKYLIK